MRTTLVAVFGWVCGCSGGPVPLYPLEGTYRLTTFFPQDTEDCDIDGVFAEAPLELTGVFPPPGGPSETGTLTFLGETLSIRIDAPTRLIRPTFASAVVRPRTSMLEHASGFRWRIDRIEFWTEARTGRDELFINLLGTCDGFWWYAPE